MWKAVSSMAKLEKFVLNLKKIKKKEIREQLINLELLLLMF